MYGVHTVSKHRVRIKQTTVTAKYDGFTMVANYYLLFENTICHEARVRSLCLRPKSHENKLLI